MSDHQRCQESGIGVFYAFSEKFVEGRPGDHWRSVSAELYKLVLHSVWDVYLHRQNLQILTPVDCQNLRIEKDNYNICMVQKSFDTCELLIDEIKRTSLDTTIPNE